MKKTLLRMLMALSLVAVLTACGSSKKTTEVETPVAEIGVDSKGVCSGQQTMIFEDKAEILGKCEDADGIDVNSLTVHILGNDIPLTTIKEENIVRNGDKIVAVKDWQMIYHIPTNEGEPFGTTATISMFSINGETLEYEKIVSVKFPVQTEAATVTPPTPEDPTPDPVNTAPTCDDLTVDANYANTYTEDVSINAYDADGDNLTGNYLSSGVSFGDITIGDAYVVGMDVTITVTSGIGEGYVIYTVTDGKAVSDPCTVTFIRLSGE